MSVKGWEKIFEEEGKKDYFKGLKEFVDSEYKQGICYPPYENIFRAFELTPLESVKAVILGQDPYHEPNQAHGLCFSVLPQQSKLPPSLKNIYKELAEEYGECDRKDGFLEDWARQGVLMLNTVMTVREHSANSHKGRGWELFTDSVLAAVNELDKPVVYMLWGAPAQKKAALVTNPKHLVLTAAHPSPLSAYRGFFGCGHFKKCNEFLSENSVPMIDWIGRNA